MRYIHPGAWIGLLLNVGLLYMVFSVLLSIDLALLPEPERAVMEGVLAAVDELRPLYYGLLLAQGLAIGLISARLSFGLWIAVAAAFLMLPVSLVYLIGCILSHYRGKYAAYATVAPDYTGARLLFPSSAVKPARSFAIAGLLLFIVTFMTGFPDIAVILLGMGCAGIYCAFRATKYHALALYDDYFTLNPTLFAGWVLLPYHSVRLATLMENKTIQFQVETEQGERILGWSLRTVEMKYRRSALEELGAALTAHRIPLQ